jgi:hypothetical protein
LALDLLLRRFVDLGIALASSVLGVSGQLSRGVEYVWSPSTDDLTEYQLLCRLRTTLAIARLQQLADASTLVSLFLSFLKLIPVNPNRGESGDLRD